MLPFEMLQTNNDSTYKVYSYQTSRTLKFNIYQLLVILNELLDLSLQN